MKTHTTYILLITLLVFVLGVVAWKYGRNSKHAAANFYSLQERKGSLANLSEWASTRYNASLLLEKIKADKSDVKSKLGLAALFIQESRVTGNHFYYDRAAMKYIDDVLKIDQQNFDALIYKSVVQLSEHHFAEALATAEQAKRINPYNAFLYGIFVDANVELGNYTIAVENADKMVSIRPDLRSYSRISYLREIYGDYPGAIEAMKMAVDAGLPGDESTEWSRVHLGLLYENSGDFKSAEMQYRISLDERPDYPYALAGIARIATVNKAYKEAEALYLKADSIMNDYFFIKALAGMYEANKQQSKAEELYKKIVHELSHHSSSDHGNESSAHHADLELANAYIDIKDYDEALDHALIEYHRRPANIEVNETLAWVYYRRGDYQKAEEHIEKALVTNSKDPELLSRAGTIKTKK